ncbi:MAG TPA: tail fiber protein [Jatrophihabitans sp.]|nr:tail fiber protein [Jatrophihabitans sp.]
MSEPFIGEIKVISFNFPPKGWAFCNGQLLPINQNQALFSILGTTYGGNGQTNFALPNFQARMPVAAGNNFNLGQQGGEVAHTLTLSEMAAHNHPGQGNATQTGFSPSGTVWAPADGALQYFPSPNTTMNPSAIGPAGGSQPHNNEAPYLVLGFIIALQGIFPSQN